MKPLGYERVAAAALVANLPKAACAAAFVLAMTTGASALTATDSFGVTITITDDCKITATNPLDFGTQGALTAAVDASSSVSIVCTTDTGYTVGLDAGEGSGATTTTRKMAPSGQTSPTIDYQLFSDSGRTVNWGNTPLTDTVSGTGNGTTQTIPIYGRVPAQTSPAAGSYTDTVTVTVTF